MAQPAQDKYDAGKEAYYDGNYKKAETLFLKSIEIREKELGHEDEQTIKAINRLAKTYGKLRDNQEALKLFEEVLKINKKNKGEVSEEVASCYQEIGNVYNQMYEPQKANEAYAKVLEIYIKIFGEESEEVSGVLMNIGSSYHKMAAYQDAEKYYLQAFDLIKKTAKPDSESYNRIYSNMGYMYRKIGDYEKALDFGKKALKVKLLNYDSMHPSVAKYHRNIGKALAEMGRVEEALPFFEKSLEITEKSLGPDHPQVAGATGELGQILLELGKYDRALKMQKKSIRLYEKSRPIDHPYVIAGYFNLAQVLVGLNEQEKALEKYNIALKRLLSRSYRPRNLIAMTYAELADVFINYEKMDTALAMCQKGLEEISKDFRYTLGDYYSNPKLEEVQAKLIFLDLLALKSKILESRSNGEKTEENLSQALRTIKLAVDLIEQMRKDFQSATSRQRLNERTTEIFEMGVRVGVGLYRQSGEEKFLWDAFEFSEKSKASILWRSINEGSALQSAHISPAQKAIIEGLERQINQLEEALVEINEGGSENQKMILQDELFEVKIDFENRLKSIELEHPEFYELRYAPQGVDKTRLIKKIKKDQVTLLHYFYDGSKIYIFLFDEKGLRVFTQDWDHQIKTFIQGISKFEIGQLSVGSNESVDIEYLQIVNALYHKLILPIAEHISGKSRLAIVPHGILNYLPFEMLAPDIGESDFRKQHYLLKDFSIQYAWSTSFWTKESGGNKTAANPYLGFAPTFVSIASVGNEIENYRSSLTELTFSSSEVKVGLDYFNGDVYINDEATEFNFRRADVDRCILHLATHAFVDDAHPMQSGLAFAFSNDSLSDAFLHAYEIYNMHLPAELAVMSACNTGYGQLVEGEGVMSLGRAFFHAGCRSVVMSHWLANDKSTSELMGYFYRYISEGKNKDEALWLAKLDYLKMADALTAHPYFWASMVAVGDMQPVKTNAEFNWKYLILIVAVVSLLIVIKKMRNQSSGI